MKKLMMIVAGSVILAGCGALSVNQVTVSDDNQTVTITPGTNGTVNVEYTDGTNSFDVTVDTESFKKLAQ